MNVSRLLTPPNESLFFKKSDPYDVRLGEIVPNVSYQESDVVILGCPQDEGVRRNGGRIGAAAAPDKIREQFYKLTPFGLNVKIFDAGDVIIGKDLEEIHANHAEIVTQFLTDNKKVVVLGGGNDISYPDGTAMAQIFGAERWLALNIDAHFDVRADQVRNSGTPYRQLLDEEKLRGRNFYEIGFQKQLNSSAYFEYLKSREVTLIDLNRLKEEGIHKVFREILSAKEAGNVFWGFDVDAVRASDAPGVSASSPVGLSGEDLYLLAAIAGKLSATRIIEFSEVNPSFDIDNRTAKLVATALHKFCSQIKSEPID